MDVLAESSDVSVLDLLRRSGGMRVNELAASMGVTGTAVRQRLSRLMLKGLVERTVARAGRGRPSHTYRLTEEGRRQTGSNFADLAIVLWKEIRSVKDIEVRRGLLQRLSRRLADEYADQLRGETREEKMQSLASLMEERGIPFEVEVESELPVLTALACPYTELAEQDRSVCAMERMMFSELLGENLTLSSCRLDGSSCCTFEVA